MIGNGTGTTEEKHHIETTALTSDESKGNKCNISSSIKSRPTNSETGSPDTEVLDTKELVRTEQQSLSLHSSPIIMRPIVERGDINRILKSGATFLKYCRNGTIKFRFVYLAEVLL